MPKITVLMPVFNAGAYLNEAIRSVLLQNFRDFEFLIIDDGSTDGSQDVIRSFSDKRINFIQNTTNIGVASTLNRGLSLAKGEYIARMDGDDISEPIRLMSQICLMDKKKDVGVCGARVRTRDSHAKGHVIRFPLDSGTIKSFILFNNPLNHPVVMMRKNLLEKYQLRYDPSCLAAQDYEFWSRCANCFDIVNLKKVLLTWRINKTGMTHRNFDASNAVAMKVQKQELARIGLTPDPIQLEFHRAVGNSSGVTRIEDLMKGRLWLEQLITINRKTVSYPEKGLKSAAAQVWFNLCVNSSGIGLSVLAEYLKASFVRNYIPPFQHVAFFAVNALLKMRKAPVGELLGSKEL